MKKTLATCFFVLSLSASLMILNGCGSSRTIYEDDFEKGYVKGWSGGEIQKEITFQNSKYALQAVDGEGGYMPLEQWKKFPVND
ncbi:MAG: hypothetical protein JW800_04310, partial [Candidatus Omnitrophica bacterium]|nr:hypothetical protein [Candidatus Omnitrophota bacterium]